MPEILEQSETGLPVSENPKNPEQPNGTESSIWQTVVDRELWPLFERVLEQASQVWDDLRTTLNHPGLTTEEIDAAIVIITHQKKQFLGQGKPLFDRLTDRFGHQLDHELSAIRHDFGGFIDTLRYVLQTLRLSLEKNELNDQERIKTFAPTYQELTANSNALRTRTELMNLVPDGTKLNRRDNDPSVSAEPTVSLTDRCERTAQEAASFWPEKVRRMIPINVQVSQESARLHVPEKTWRILSIVLRGLITNALQAISDSTDQQGNIDVVVDQTTIELLLIVRDSGPGIEPDVLPRIFERGFTTKEAGTGLGLADHRKLLESINGSLSVTTHVAHERNHGTTALVTVPLMTPAQPSIDTDSPPIEAKAA
jgi:signal transduction histidine kinase